MRLFPHAARFAAAAIAFGVAAATLIPSQAQAWWARPGVWVAGPPPVVIVPAPRVYYAPYPRHHWVRPHYDWRGVFIPGHWI